MVDFSDSKSVNFTRGDGGVVTDLGRFNTCSYLLGWYNNRHIALLFSFYWQFSRPNLLFDAFLYDESDVNGLE